MADDGLKAAVAGAMAGGGDGLPAAGEQLALLPLLPAEAVAGLPDDAAERRLALTGQAGRRGPGRPPGARNRRTEDWAEFILSRYRSPLVVLAETYSRPVADLAAELGCDRATAFQAQQRAAEALAPYLHGKMPVKVDLGGALPVLHLVAPDAFLGAQMAAGETVENQGLADMVARPVGRPELDGSQKPEADQCLGRRAPLTANQPARAAEADR